MTASSSSPIISNNPDAAAAVDWTRKKRRHKLEVDDDGNQAAITQLRWRSDNERRIYSARLMEAIRNARQGSSSSTSPAAVGKNVKAAADRVLAASSRGTTRWSRAILTSRLKLQSCKRRTLHQKSKKSAARVVPGRRRIIERSTRIPVLQKKVKVLSRLVPGCRNAPLPNLLEETTDYIAALEMQVRAMTVLTELLSGAPANSMS